MGQWPWYLEGNGGLPRLTDVILYAWSKAASIGSILTPFRDCHASSICEQIRVELSAPDGQLTLSTVAGLTFESGSGSGDGFLAFTGHTGDVNRALRGAVYRGDPHWNTLGQSPNSLTIVVSNSHADLGGLEPVAVESTHKLW